MLSMSRNKTKTERVGSIYRSEAKPDQQLHCVHFRDLSLFFLLSAAELPGGTTHYSRSSESPGH